MKLKECMTRNVTTVSQVESLQHAAEKMRDYHVGFLPVINLAGLPMGVITDRDIAIRVVADGLPFNKPIYEVMSEHVHHLDADAEVEDAVALMKEKNIGRVVVTNELNQVCGVFSLGDAAIALGDHVVGAAVMEAVGRHSQAPASHPPALL